MGKPHFRASKSYVFTELDGHTSTSQIVIGDGGPHTTLKDIRVILKLAEALVLKMCCISEWPMEIVKVSIPRLHARPFKLVSPPVGLWSQYFCQFPQWVQCGAKFQTSGLDYGFNKFNLINTDRALLLSEDLKVIIQRHLWQARTCRVPKGVPRG